MHCAVWDGALKEDGALPIKVGLVIVYLGFSIRRDVKSRID